MPQYGTATGSFFLHPIIFTRGSSCCFYPHSSPDYWSSQERREDHQLPYLQLYTREAEMLGIKIPKQKEYALSSSICLWDSEILPGSSLAWSHTNCSCPPTHFPSLPSCGLVEPLFCPCPQNMAPSNLLLSGTQKTTALVSREPSPSEWLLSRYCLIRCSPKSPGHRASAGCPENPVVLTPWCPWFLLQNKNKPRSSTGFTNHNNWRNASVHTAVPSNLPWPWPPHPKLAL